MSCSTIKVTGGRSSATKNQLKLLLKRQVQPLHQNLNNPKYLEEENFELVNLLYSVSYSYIEASSCFIFQDII